MRNPRIAGRDAWLGAGGLCLTLLLIGEPACRLLRPSRQLEPGRGLPFRQSLFLDLSEFIIESGEGNQRYLQLKQDPYRNDLQERLRLLVAPDCVLVSSEATIPDSARLELQVGLEVHEVYLPKEGQSTQSSEHADLVRNRFCVRWRESAGSLGEDRLLAEKTVELLADSQCPRTVGDWSVDLADLCGHRGRFVFATLRIQGSHDPVILPTWWSPTVTAQNPPAPLPAEKRVEIALVDLLQAGGRVRAVETGKEAIDLWSAAMPQVVLGEHGILDDQGNPRMNGDRPELRKLVRPLVGLESHFDPGPGLYVPKGGSRPSLAFAASSSIAFAPPSGRWPCGELRFSLSFFAWDLPLQSGSARVVVRQGDRSLAELKIAQSSVALENGWTDELSIALPQDEELRHRELVLEVAIDPLANALETRIQSPGRSRFLPASIERSWLGIARPRIVGSRTVARRQRSSGSSGPVNVLFLCVETLRKDFLGCYGREPSPTPFLDRRCAKMLRFDQPLSPQPWTTPSVASYFTGKDPAQHGVVSEEQDQLGDWCTTLAEAASSSGVTTAAFVTNELLRPETGLAAGFETYCLSYAANAMQLRRAFLDWLSTIGNENFFAYLHLFEPHSPLNAPGEFRNRWVPERLKNLPYFETERRVKESLLLGDASKEEEALQYLRGRYAGEIAFLDLQIDLLLSELEQLGFLEDTLVLLTADHGEEFGEQRWYGHGSRLPRVSYEVPLMIMGRGVEPGVVHGAVSVHRITTTCTLSVLGLEDLAQDLGLPMLSLPFHERCFALDPRCWVSTEKGIDLRSEPGPEFHRHRTEHFRRRPMRAVHLGRKKLFFQLSGLPVEAQRFESVAPLLEQILEIDLEEDPDERRPLHLEPEELTQEAKDALLALLQRELSSTPFLPTYGIPPEVKRILEELGYANSEEPPRPKPLNDSPSDG